MKALILMAFLTAVVFAQTNDSLSKGACNKPNMILLKDKKYVFNDTPITYSNIKSLLISIPESKSHYNAYLAIKSTGFLISCGGLGCTIAGLTQKSSPSNPVSSLTLIGSAITLVGLIVNFSSESQYDKSIIKYNEIICKNASE